MNFLAPAAFLFAAAIPVVVLFYLLKRKRVVRLVSSTVLWQRFLAETQASAPFQRLRHNWLLVLQVLMLVLAVLALARPFLAARVAGGRLQVVILDASASMQSRDETPSRFEKARGGALELVDSLRDTDQMVVLQAAGATEVLQSATSEKSALRRAIEGSRVTDGPTRLIEALKMAESLTRDNPEAEVHLFSDGAVLGLDEVENQGLPLVFHCLGTQANNLGLVALDVRPHPDDPTRRAIFANIANVTAEERTVDVTLYFEDQLLESKVLTLSPTNTAPVVFLATQPYDGVFRVQFEAEDDLAADNQAAMVSRLPQPVRVLLVTRGNRFLEKALRAAGSVELGVSADLASADPPFDIVVLDGVVPTVWPDRNVLAIRSFPEGWFDEVGTVEAPPIVDWRSTHPVLRFVNLDNIRIAQSLLVTLPSWAVSLVESPQTPVVLAGELGRQRLVWVGFDFLESTWPLRWSFPVFVANVVDWLNPASIRSRQLLVQAGDPFRLALSEPVTEAEITYPDGRRRRLDVDPEGGELVFGDTLRQGLYRVQLGTNETAFAVNLLDAAETQTQPQTELDFGRFGTVAANTTRRASLEIWRWIALAGLIVLLGEWWYYHRRTA